MTADMHICTTPRHAHILQYSRESWSIGDVQRRAMTVLYKTVVVFVAIFGRRPGSRTMKQIRRD